MQNEKKIKCKYKPKMLFLKPYDYDGWLKNVKLTDKEELTDKEKLSIAKYTDSSYQTTNQYYH